MMVPSEVSDATRIDAGAWITQFLCTEARARIVNHEEFKDGLVRFRGPQGFEQSAQVSYERVLEVNFTKPVVHVVHVHQYKDSEDVLVSFSCNGFATFVRGDGWAMLQCLLAAGYTLRACHLVA